ncbi:MAG: PDZ domain-containing protein [Planctomycetota bacterium]|jgi:hypothetical protein
MNNYFTSFLLGITSLLVSSSHIVAGEAPPAHVDRKGWLGARLEQKPDPRGGIRVQQVVAGGPAAAGGLRDGDVILTFGGAKVGSFDILVKLITATTPGTKVILEVRRGKPTLKVHVTIGHRRQSLGPMIEGGRESFPGNGEIHPDWEGRVDDFEAYVMSYLRRERATDLYENLVRAFVEDEDLYRVHYKLNEVSYVRRAPLKTPLAARFLTDGIQEAFDRKDGPLAALVRVASGSIDVPLDDEVPSPGPSPKDVMDGLAIVHGLAHRAFDKLSGGERAFLFHQAVPLFVKFKEHIYLQAQSSEVLYRNNLLAIRMSKSIDYRRLFLAGVASAALAECAAKVPKQSWRLYAEEEGKESANPPAWGDVMAIVDTDVGPVIIGGPGRTVYTGDAALIVDLGGDDVYLNNAGGSTKTLPIALLIDHGGNDTYRGSSVCQGCGRMGAGVLLDLAGDDFYQASDFAQGAGLFGVGLLYDREGNDTYSAGEYQAGAGLFGIGILADGSGNDRYSAHLYSQGFGATKGIGILLDGTGSDVFYASGKYPSGYGTAGVFRGMSQGFGIGFRQIASGGIGVLLDGGGNDHYIAGNFSQGGGYFFSLGILRDRGGNDRYTASRYNQGFGVHSAAGILLDDRGDDRYRCEVAANQGSAWDLGVGFLIDGKGNDRYEAHGLAQGGASQNGFAVLLDLEGKDDYHARGTGQGFGGQTTYGGGRGARNLGILLDAGGGKDTFSKKGRKDNLTSLDEMGGLFADIPVPLGQADQRDEGKEKGPGEEKKPEDDF